MDEQQKKAYMDKVQAQFDEWDADLKVLQAKADKAKAEAKIKYLEKINELKTKREELNQKVDHLKESGSEAWDELKLGLENSWDELKSGLKNALEALKDHPPQEPETEESEPDQ